MAGNFQQTAHGWMTRRPRHGLERAAFWLVLWFLVLWLLRWVPGVVGGLAAGLQILIAIVLAMVALPLLWTWVRTRLLWSVRSKLLLTYALVGVAPVFLLGTLVLVSAYVAAGQFAIHLVDTRIQQELDSMSAQTSFRTGQLAVLVDGHPVRETVTVMLPPERRAPGTDVERNHDRRTIRCFVDGTSAFQPPPASVKAPFGFAPWAMQLNGGRFRGIVSDGGELYLVAVHQQRMNDGRAISVVSSLPMDGPVVDMLAEGLGVVSLLPESASRPLSSEAEPQPENGSARRKGQRFLSEIRGGVPARRANFADIRVRFLSTLAMTDWNQGSPDNIAVVVDSRPSLLYQRLFGASLSGWVMTVIRASLILLMVLFGIIELVALAMAVGVSRTMTQSVADLYGATQRVDRGDFQHRITVTRSDQLAELSRSFNTMMGSLQRLLVEQKEKERLQNELSIAQQVQANLFPRGACDLPTLELHGVCRPARSVSGDYYDFLVFYEDLARGEGVRPQRREAGVGIAIGDISGKGISAALLMATLHSAVRAYQFAGEDLVFAGSTLEGLMASKEGLADAGGWFQSPGRIMSLLNRHLFRSTQPEKYATLFLAHYDARSSALTYSNAGQLPPFVLGRDGAVRRLEEGGTVVGLMDGMHFAEGRLVMQSGDILVAYSDGVTEPENDFGDFGETRLLEVVARYRDHPLHVISAQVMLALDAWIGAEEQPDDITLVLARQA